MFILSVFTWTASLLLLLIAAGHKFNTPPTQRSGTTFFLFHFGQALYYLLLLMIWTVALLMIREGLLPPLGRALKVDGELEPAAPLLATLVVVLGYVNASIQRADTEARRICSEWAAIPREKDALALEIREHAVFEVKHETLRRAVATEVEKRKIDPRVVDFSGATPDASASTLLTKAFTLYCVVFVPPWTNLFRSFLTSHKTEAVKAQKSLEGLVPLAQDYFRLQNPAPEVTEPFTKRVGEVLGLLTHLVSRAVLATERTKKGRYRRLAAFGFWLEVPRWRPSLDLVVAVIGAAAVYFSLLFILIPRPESRSFSDVLLGSLPISVEIGIATALGIQAAIWSERRDGSADLPPLALWLGMALFAAILCGMARLLIFAIPHVEEGVRVAVNSGWQELTSDRRVGWRLMSAFITLGLAVACHCASGTRGSRNNLAKDASIVVAFVVLGGILVKGLRPDHTPDWMWLITSVSLLGLALGATIPPLYRRGTVREAQLRQSVNLVDAPPLSAEEPAPSESDTGGAAPGDGRPAPASSAVAVAAPPVQAGGKARSRARGRARPGNGRLPAQGPCAASPPRAATGLDRP